jgi:hypothetical protein
MQRRTRAVRRVPVPKVVPLWCRAAFRRGTGLEWNQNGVCLRRVGSGTPYAVDVFLRVSAGRPGTRDGGGRCGCCANLWRRAAGAATGKAGRQSVAVVKYVWMYVQYVPIGRVRCRSGRAPEQAAGWGICSHGSECTAPPAVIVTVVGRRTRGGTPWTDPGRECTQSILNDQC